MVSTRSNNIKDYRKITSVDFDLPYFPSTSLNCPFHSFQFMITLMARSCLHDLEFNFIITFWIFLPFIMQVKDMMDLESVHMEYLADSLCM